MIIDVPVLVVGGGPAALVATKVAGGWGLSTLLVGHVPIVGADEHDPVALDPEAVAVLEVPGILNILRPYLSAVTPPTITTADFEDVVKHHCVVDMNVTVYDAMEFVLTGPAPGDPDGTGNGGGVVGVLTDGRARWDVRADTLIDTSTSPRALSDAVRAGGAAAQALLAARTGTVSPIPT